MYSTYQLKLQEKAKSRSQAPPQQPSPQPQPPQPEPLPKRVQALYDCDGDEDDELTFCSGEIIQVTGFLLLSFTFYYIILTGQEDDDWWIGNIEGFPHRHGCFPVIFVTKLAD